MSQIYTLVYSSQAKKALNKIPLFIVKRIFLKLKELEKDPSIGTKMHGDLSYLYKIKLSNYRIIYQIIQNKMIISVIEIESRGNMSYDR